jgi:hypothetical protein
MGACSSDVTRALCSRLLVGFDRVALLVASIELSSTATMVWWWQLLGLWTGDQSGGKVALCSVYIGGH